MLVELLWKGAWVPLPHATAHHVVDNQYRVIIPDFYKFMPIRDSRKLHGLPLRLDGREMYSVYGIGISDTLTAEVEGLV
jgi:hypothetical protein